MVQLIAGVDEAGRGPLAGPVVTAAVILPEGLSIQGLTDSKQLSAKRRAALYTDITSVAVAYSIASASVAEIDHINILEATMLAMQRAVEGLACVPSLVLVDGNRLPALSVPAKAVVRGDQTEASISAASILAKVTRDRMMHDLDQQYPGYGWAKNQGYGTAAHYEAIATMGVTPAHRQSFRLHK